MIVCICRGKSDREISRAIDHGASTVRDLQRCGIGDQCGSCHSMLRTMLAQSAAAAAAVIPCPGCTQQPVAAHAHA